MHRTSTWFPGLLALAIAALAFALGLPSRSHAATAAGGAGQRTVRPAKGEGEVALLLPLMNPARGRTLFANKGCVVCHSINGVGGTDAPALDASTMPEPMNPFDFAARMWRGAPAMIAMQKQELGHQIEFTGQELADIIAFAHDRREQKKLTAADIPARIRKLMNDDAAEGRRGTFLYRQLTDSS